MRLCTLASVSKNSWGILAPYKEEILKGGFGALDRAYAKAISNDFLSLKQLSERFHLSQYRIRKLLKNSDIQYVIVERQKRFYLPGINSILRGDSE